MKKIYLILFLSISMVLCLFGCNASVEQGNDDSNDTQVEDQNNDAGSSEVDTEEPDPVEIIVEKPVIQEVYIHCEKDALADMYVKNLYDYMIVYSDEINHFHSGSLVESSTFTMREMKRLAYWIGWRYYLYDANSYSYFGYDHLEKTVKSIFGSDVEINEDGWGAGGLSFVYEENRRRFCGDSAYGGDYPVGMIFDYFGKYEIDGDYLYVYDRVLFCDHDRWGTGIIKFYADINKTEESYVNEFQVGSYLPHDFSNDEALEQYGAEYKHTFKLAEDGSGYYWVSSEPVK